MNPKRTPDLDAHTRTAAHGEPALAPRPVIPVLPARPPSLPPEGATHSHVPVMSAPGTGGRIGIAVVALAVALIAVFAFGLVVRHREKAKLDLEAQKAADAPTGVEVTPVRRADPNTVLTLPGEARALNETTIYARTNGYL